ncbi:DUF4166 domain-containing protein [Novosphingobium sp. P6W]|uniref:DUF4166 domain-containing protein n=1 Tax=Novosphingobium sp. P6W TaxID=1609758 RepID=UPI0005C2AF23|nr:DUF4166 domain-containing protein [Novosphingobium sp. P6W]AXB78572.1 DUF4166 domain-containing protein [Novosphingobium sp. P6W]KIS29378.1 hypothetical protein TQ38_28600 [Novosphingobium sp. P6W]
MNPPLFRRLLPGDMDALPPVLRAAHDADDRQHWEGLAHVTLSRNPIARLLCRMMKLPAQGHGVPVSVVFERLAHGERWRRIFAGRSYRSDLTVRDGLMVERMGLATNIFRVSYGGGQIMLDLVAFRFLGLSLPSWLRPRCRATEREQDGRYVFDVPVSLPLLGPIIHYTGSMERRDA